MPPFDDVKYTANGALYFFRATLVSLIGSAKPTFNQITEDLFDHNGFSIPGVAKIFGPRAIFRNVDEGAGHTT